MSPYREPGRSIETAPMTIPIPPGWIQTGLILMTILVLSVGIVCFPKVMAFVFSYGILH